MPCMKNTQKAKLSTETEQRIIKQVQQHPALYSVKNQFYYNTKYKSNTWESIAAILGEDKNVVQDTWDSIKSKFKRETKKIDSAVAKKEIYSPNWPHYQILSFLQEASLPKTTCSNLEELFTSTSGKQSDKTQRTSSPSVQTMNQATLKPDGSPNKQEKESEDMTFFHSLLQHVVVVPPESKLIMRNEIHDVVMKYAYKKPETPQNENRSQGNYFNPNHFIPEDSNGVLRDYNQVNRRRFNDEYYNRNTFPMIDPGSIKKEKRRKIGKPEYDSDDSDCVCLDEFELVRKKVKRNAEKAEHKEESNTASGPALLTMDLLNYPANFFLQQMALQQQLMRTFNPAMLSPASAPVMNVSTPVQPDIMSATLASKGGEERERAQMGKTIRKINNI